MAANQPNSSLFTYVDDAANTWNKRGPIDAAINAVDGSTALTAGEPVWTDSPSHSCRKAVYVDTASTFRSKKFPVYTSAAFAALPATLAVAVQGSATTVTYALSQKIAEKQRQAKTSRNLIDHA